MNIYGTSFTKNIPYVKYSLYLILSFLADSLWQNIDSLFEKRGLSRSKQETPFIGGNFSASGERRVVYPGIAGVPREIYKDITTKYLALTHRIA